MDRNFAKLWIGQAISQTGSRISREGLPLTAVLVLGASPLQMGYLSGASAAAVLLFGLFAGAWSDRLRRRPVMIFADLARAALLASIPLSAMAGSLSITHLYVVASLTAVLSLWFDVSYQAYLPALVAPEELVKGNSRLALSEGVAEVAGPGLTGILVQRLTAPMAILADAASFVVSALSLLLIRKPEPAPRRLPGESIVREIGEGIGLAWRHPVLRALLLRTGFASFFFGFPAAMYMLFAVRDLRITPALLGLVIAVGGLSSLFGAAVNEWLVARLGLRRTLILAALGGGLSALFPPLAQGSALRCAGILALGQAFDFSWTVYGINEVSLRQTLAPEAVLGRVNSAMQILFRGLMPVGSLAAGMVAAQWSIRAALLVGAAGILLSTLCLVVRREADHLW